MAVQTGLGDEKAQVPPSPAGGRLGNLAARLLEAPTGGGGPGADARGGAELPEHLTQSIRPLSGGGAAADKDIAGHPVPHDTLARGVDHLREEYAPESTDFPPLWIGKSAYVPVQAVQGAVLAALLAAEGVV